MGDLTADQFVAELQRRLTSLDSTTALNAINAAIEQINRATSYTFNTNSASTILSVTASGGFAATAAVPANSDLGKEIAVFNANGTPVRRVSPSEFWMSQNYNIPVQSPVQYDCYTFAGPSVGGSMMFVPNASGNVTVFSTFQSTAISGAANSALPRDFDRLIVDLAEAEERRIYDIGDWATLYARAKEDLKLLADAYKTMTNEPAGVTESANKVEEEQKLGRA